MLEGYAASKLFQSAPVFITRGRRTRTRHHERSKRAIQAAARKGADAMKAKVWTDEELDAKAVNAKRLGRRALSRWTLARGGWTRAQRAALGTDHDEGERGWRRSPTKFMRRE